MFSRIMRTVSAPVVALAFAVSAIFAPTVALWQSVMASQVAMRPQGQRGVAATGFVIGIAVAILVAALIVPIAFDSFFGADTASWDAQTVLIWGIIPVVGLLTIVLYFLNRADSQA